METLLIAIKSDSIRSALAKRLSQYKIHTCDTGTEALEILETLHPTVLIIDFTLPDMGGLTVLQKSHYKPRVILALTNLASDAVLQASAAAGVQDVILIPCTIRHIISHLDAFTEKVPSPET